MKVGPPEAVLAPGTILRPTLRPGAQPETGDNSPQSGHSNDPVHRSNHGLPSDQGVRSMSRTSRDQGEILLLSHLRPFEILKLEIAITHKTVCRFLQNFDIFYVYE